MEIFNALSYLSIAGKIDMSVEKRYVNEADWGCGCFILTRNFVSCDILFFLLTQLNRRENNVGRDKRGFGQ
mgnify:CR=1 FL=1